METNETKLVEPGNTNSKEQYIAPEIFTFVFTPNTQAGLTAGGDGSQLS